VRDIYKSGTDKSDGKVAVFNDGRTAIFSHGSTAVRVEAGAWSDIDGGKWADSDGIYGFSEQGVGAAEESRMRPQDFDSIFKPIKPSDNTVVFSQAGLQDLVRDAKRAKILSFDGEVVLARNPDGTMAWAGSDPGYGSVTVRAQDGAVPIGAFNMGNVEKIARVMQRAGHERVDIEIRSMQDTTQAPSPTSTTIMVLRGEGAAGAVGGKSLKESNSTVRRFTDAGPDAPAPDTTAMSTRGPGRGQDPGRNIPRDIPRAQAAGSERLPYEGITGTGVDDVRGVPGDQARVNATNASPQSGVDPGIKKPDAPAWVRQPPVTKQGKKLVGRIKSDPRGLRYGVRTIAEGLTKAIDPLIVRQVREADGTCVIEALVAPGCPADAEGTGRLIGVLVIEADPGQGFSGFTTHGCSTSRGTRSVRSFVKRTLTSSSSSRKSSMRSRYGPGRWLPRTAPKRGLPSSSGATSFRPS